MTGNDAAGRGASRYVVVHGHFYQPPRESPWLDFIEKQGSASPYHDWNERIYDQCYRPNAFSRILDSHGMIVDIHNNYLHLSHNFGPTLFLWLEKNHPKVAEKIVAADRESYVAFKKHGNAIAQVYNHMILPLAPRRDKLTQIRWAKEFFRRRYKRETEGFWLAETAINMETVQCLIEEGVKFVVLSPTQAESFRSLDGRDQWQSPGSGIDTRRTYRIFNRAPDGTRLGGHLDTFFFNEGLSREVSFGDLLVNANTLGAKIRSCYDDAIGGDQAVVIATDGETFGHHKPFGDMCLAYFFSRVAAEMNIVPVNFGYYLEKNPPAFEVTLKNEFGEGTAWSCAHGVGRWSRDCGCKAGGPLSWNQAWRGPLRTAFERLQKHIDDAFEKKVSPYVQDPWKLRDAYQNFAGAKTLREFKVHLVEYGVPAGCSDKDAMALKRLLEAQKYMLFAFTSCGWFFSDVSGIETVQNIMYAGRALQLGLDEPEREAVTAEFVQLLSAAKSNIPDKDGATLFREAAAPYLHHLEILCFTAIAEKAVAPDMANDLEFDYYGYEVSLSKRAHKTDKGRCNLFAAHICNAGSGEQADFSLCLAKDDGRLDAWCVSGAAAMPEAGAQAPESFKAPQGSVALGLSSLFDESKVRLAGYFLGDISKDTREKYASWMDRNERSLDSLSALGVPLPAYVVAPIAYVLTAQWNTTINEIEIYGREDDVWTRLLDLWNKTRKYGITIDYAESARLLLELLVAELKIFEETLSEVSAERMRYLLNIVDRFAIPLSKNKTEDLFFSIMKTTLMPLYDEFKKSPESTHRDTVIRLVQFARRMNFNTDAFPVV
jgi:alpha-amylase/alpha-mannosidase (GH57 family)